MRGKTYFYVVVVVVVLFCACFSGKTLVSNILMVIQRISYSTIVSTSYTKLPDYFVHLSLPVHLYVAQTNYVYVAYCHIRKLQIKLTVLDLF